METGIDHPGHFSDGGFCLHRSVLGLKWVFARLVYEGKWPWWGIVVYILCIVPLYNLLLLFWGFIFGQYPFFIAYEKRFLNRITRRFKKKK